MGLRGKEMPSSTEVKVGTKKLFIDLDVCCKCPECVIKCDYYYHPNNNGITELREKAHFALVCRKCEEADCVSACPKEALKKSEEGILVRSNMLCVGCNSCALACPFGTIYKETIPFLTLQCDLCVDRCEGRDPLCVTTCPYGALKFGDFQEEKEKHIYRIKEGLIVHSTPWKKE